MNRDLHLCTCPAIPYRHLHREGCGAVCLLCKAQDRREGVPGRIKSAGPRRSRCGFCPETFRTATEARAHRKAEHRTF